MSALQEYIDLRKQMEAKLEEFGTDMVTDLLKPQFERYPLVEGVKWTQYAPYFNDGDPCVFRVHEPGVKITGGRPDAGDYEDGYADAWSVKYDTDPQYETNRDGTVRDDRFAWPEGSAEMISVFANIISAIPDDILEKVFGECAEVTINRDGTITNEEVDHD